MKDISDTKFKIILKDLKGNFFRLRLWLQTEVTSHPTFQKGDSLQSHDLQGDSEMCSRIRVSSPFSSLYEHKRKKERFL